MAWVSPSTVVPDKTYYMNGVKVNVYLLKNHNVNNIALPSKRTNKFKGVVIHNTDRAYSAIGVQMHVVNEFSKFPKINFRGFYATPIIMDFDTLIDLSYRLNRRELHLESLLLDYLLMNKTRLAPFSNYIEDNYKRKKGKLLDNEIRYLFDDIVKDAQLS